MEPMIVKCPYCLRVREALSALNFQLDAMSDYVEIRDGDRPMDVSDVHVSCAQCHDTGHMLTAEGDQLLAVLVARLKSIAGGKSEPEEVIHD